MKLINGMICPVCEDGVLVEARKKVKFAYKGVESNVEGRVFGCDQCGESFWDPKDERAIERMLTDERRKIDGLLTSDQIRSIRESFGFTQAQFARALGVGEKNFARYETGASMQGKTTDQLLRILMQLPKALELITKEQVRWETRERIQATVQKVQSLPGKVEVSCSATSIEDEGDYAYAV